MAITVDIKKKTAENAGGWIHLVKDEKKARFAFRVKCSEYGDTEEKIEEKIRTQLKNPYEKW